MFVIKTTRKFSFHDFIIYSIVLSSCFVLSGCSSKNDEGKISKQAALIESLQKEIVKLRTENDELQHSLAESRDKIEKQADYKLDNEEIKQLDKTEEQVGSKLLNAQRQRLKQKNADLKKALAQATEKTKWQDDSELYAEVERLKQKNNELKKLLDETIARVKVLTTLASLKNRRTRERQYKEQAEAVIAEFDSKVSSKRKLELIDSLTESAVEQHPSVIDIVQKILDDPDPEVGRAAIALLEDYETTEIIPVISQALESRDEQTRIGALALLANANDPQVIDLLVEALKDTSEDVRSAVLEVAQEQVDDIQLNVLEEGIASSYEDVKSEALSLLEDRSDHASVEIIITGLLDEDPKFREKVNLALYFFVDQEFETYETALTWWDQNKHKYDENLFEIEDDDN